MARPGRGHIACTPELQLRILFMVKRGTPVREAAGTYGMSDAAVYRQAARDPQFRRALTAAEGRRARRPSDAGSINETGAVA